MNMINLKEKSRLVAKLKFIPLTIKFITNAPEYAACISSSISCIILEKFFLKNKKIMCTEMKTPNKNPIMMPNSFPAVINIVNIAYIISI
jgi:hypothetical protein